MQPSTRNFDLNDRPLTYPDVTEHGPRASKTPQKVSSFGKPKQEPVISIFGAKVEVNKKDHVSQTLSLPNGNKGFETAFDVASMTAAGGRFLGMGPGNPYQHQHPHIWAFNGLTAGPTVSLAPAVYRPGSSIPYMLDPRSVPAVPFSYPQAPAPFMLSMAPGPFALNGPYPAPGPMRPHLDLNSGFSMSDEVNRESTAVLRQFFVPDHARPTEEHIRAGLPPTSSGSGIGTKRKEPEGGWEPFPLTFRQQQPPWK
ncbi:hypothetical protein MLD38_022199 [Melastoma candidum]|nr:hypothetical protein MLD38_022199 [Melastoma candidum]